MQFSLLPATLLLSIASAATTSFSIATPVSTISLSTGQSTACAAQDILDTCIASNMGYVLACNSADYGCLCSKWNDVLTCYLQCPNDANRASALANKNAYCNSNSQFPSSTSAVVSRPVSTSAGTATGTAASGDTTSGGVRASGSGTATAAGSSSTAKSGAEGLVLGAGSVLVGLAGVVAAVL
ncbi:hypothetical protein BGZ60DRAFT_395718 [Tricladium varicosporioides]|nr:hypothetical protein BGZ60DRAFT_395718 [Hymenoscyphus varicosporioides]